MRFALALATAALFSLGGPAAAEPVSVLFVGNSYTFGRVNPVMQYNAANVRDLTAAMAASSPAGSNVFEPHPWGGVAGIFKQFTVQAGLDYDVALSTRNAASLRGHLLNSNPANWDLRGNIASQTWSKVVLQEQSDEALPKQPGLASNPSYFKTYVDLIEDFVHNGTALSYRERDLIGGSAAACQAETGGANTNACNALRSIPANSFAAASTQVYLYQTWARPNLIDGAFTSTTDEATGAVTRTTTPASTFYRSLETMTEDLRLAYADAARQAGADGTGGIAGIAPVGQSFLRAVTSGLATRDFYSPGALTDGLLDLWFDDGTHASTWGSYLSALTLYGTLTGLDPASLGANEKAARELGISQTDALALQRVASDQLGFAVTPIPEPETVALLAGGLALLAAHARRRSRRT